MKIKISSTTLLSLFSLGAQIHPVLAAPPNPSPPFSKPSTLSLLINHKRGNDSFINMNSDGTITLKFNKTPGPTQDMTSFGLKPESLMFLKDKGPRTTTTLLHGNDQNNVTLKNGSSLKISTKGKDGSNKVITFNFDRSKLKISSNKRTSSESSKRKDYNIFVDPRRTPDIKFDKTTIFDGNSSTNTKLSINPGSGQANYKIVETKNPAYTLSIYEDPGTFDKKMVHNNGTRTSTQINKTNNTTKYTQTNPDGSSIETTTHGDGSTKTITTNADGSKKIIKNEKGFTSSGSYKPDGTLDHKNITVVKGDGGSNELHIKGDAIVVVNKNSDGDPQSAMKLTPKNPPKPVDPREYQ